MNLTRLRYFDVVADELHFGRAADRLHIAQPALSQAIRVLEGELGVDLFDRTTRRVELTTAGELLVPEARRLLANAAAVERLMRDHARGDTGLLRVGFVDSASYAVMPSFLRRHRERHPGVRFDLHAMSSAAQASALAAGELDLGFARTPSTDADLDSTVLLEEPLVVAVPAGHRLAQQASTTLARLSGESFIGFDRAESPALAAELESLLWAAGVAWEPILEAEEYTTVLGLVAAGEGIAIVPAVVQSFQPSNLHYLKLRDPSAMTRLVLLSRRNERLNLVHRARGIALERFSNSDR